MCRLCLGVCLCADTARTCDGGVRVRRARGAAARARTRRAIGRRVSPRSAPDRSCGSHQFACAVHRASRLLPRAAAARLRGRATVPPATRLPGPVPGDPSRSSPLTRAPRGRSRMIMGACCLLCRCCAVRRGPCAEVRAVINAVYACRRLGVVVPVCRTWSMVPKCGRRYKRGVPCRRLGV